MKKIFSLLLSIASLLSEAQQQKFSLADIIAFAQAQSPGYKLAATQKEISYYQYVSFRSDLRPQVQLYGNVPVYNKEFFGVRQPDGTIRYQSISQNNSIVGLGIGQQLAFTGGELSLNTGLSRFDDFKGKTKQYSGTPVFLRYSQPLFAVNELKWRKKIEPLKLEESKKQFVQRMEALAQQVSELYFDVLDAQNEISLAESNLRSSGINYEIEKKRISLGTTTEDKLLQLELQVLRSNQDLEKARYNYQVALLSLRTYIGITGNDEMILSEPGDAPFLDISATEAIEHAKRNRPEFAAFIRKKEEARRDVALAKAAKQQVDLVASYGLNNIGNNISAVYRNPNDQQRFSIGFNIPVVDWGRRNARYNTARAIQKLTEATNEFDEMTIYQEITILVKNVELLKTNITLTKKTDSVAQRRFILATGLYQSGKLSITELNIAQNEKDNAHRSYLNSLRAYWNAYYSLRQMTLYDFEKKVSLYANE